MEKIEKGRNQVKPDMNRNVKIWLMLAILIVVTLLALYWTTIRAPMTRPFEPRRWPINRIRGDIELFYTVKTIVSTINATLLIFLLISYLDIYQKTRSEFTIGLIIFSMALLLYALVSNPIVQWTFGFQGFGLGPFAVLPDLFTCVASAVLLYFTLKY